MSEKANEVQETLHEKLGKHMFDLICELPPTTPGPEPRSQFIKATLGAEVARLMHWAVYHATTKIGGECRAWYFAEVARDVPLTLPPEGWSSHDDGA